MWCWHRNELKILKGTGQNPEADTYTTQKFKIARKGKTNCVETTRNSLRKNLSFNRNSHNEYKYI